MALSAACLDSERLERLVLIDASESREALRMTHADLGRALGVVRNTLARWERGELLIRHSGLVALGARQVIATA